MKGRNEVILSSLEKNISTSSALAETRKDIHQILHSLLSLTPMTVDDFLSHCQCDGRAVAQILGEMEVEGLVESLPGDRVALLPKTIEK